MFSCKSLSCLLLVAALSAGAIGPAVLPVAAQSSESGENGASLSVSAKDAVYTGQPYAQSNITATPNGISGGETTFSYQQNVDGNWVDLPGAPTNVGNYRVTGNYSTADPDTVTGFTVPASIDLNIGQANQTGSIAPTAQPTTAELGKVTYGVLMNKSGSTNIPATSVPGSNSAVANYNVKTTQINGLVNANTAEDPYFTINASTGEVTLKTTNGMNDGSYFATVSAQVGSSTVTKYVQINLIAPKPTTLVPIGRAYGSQAGTDTGYTGNINVLGDGSSNAYNVSLFNGADTYGGSGNITFYVGYSPESAAIPDGASIQWNLRTNNGALLGGGTTGSFYSNTYVTAPLIEYSQTASMSASSFTVGFNQGTGGIFGPGSATINSNGSITAGNSNIIWSTGGGTEINDGDWVDVSYTVYYKDGTSQAAKYSYRINFTTQQVGGISQAIPSSPIVNTGTSVGASTTSLPVSLMAAQSSNAIVPANGQSLTFTNQETSIPVKMVLNTGWSDWKPGASILTGQNSVDSNIPAGLSWYNPNNKEPNPGKPVAANNGQEINFTLTGIKTPGTYNITLFYTVVVGGEELEQETTIPIQIVAAPSALVTTPQQKTINPGQSMQISSVASTSGVDLYGTWMNYTVVPAPGYANVELSSGQKLGDPDVLLNNVITLNNNRDNTATLIAKDWNGLPSPVTVVITATYYYGGPDSTVTVDGKPLIAQGTCEVTIYPTVNSFTTDSTIGLTVGQNYQLPLSAGPKDCTVPSDIDYTYTSRNGNIFTVSDAGVLTGKAVGQGTLYAAWENENPSTNMQTSTIVDTNGLTLSGSAVQAVDVITVTVVKGQSVNSTPAEFSITPLAPEGSSGGTGFGMGETYGVNNDVNTNGATAWNAAPVYVGGKQLTADTDYTKTLGSLLPASTGNNYYPGLVSMIGNYQGSFYVPTVNSWTEVYTDTTGSFAQKSFIPIANMMGLMTGTTPTTFTPGRAMTRGELITTIWRMADEPSVPAGTTPFPDVPADSFYYTAANWARAVGITVGDGKNAAGQNIFNGQKSVERQQAVTFLYRYGKDVAKVISKDKVVPQADNYPDAAQINPGNLPGVNWALNNLVLTGKGTTTKTIAPRDSLLRDAAAKVLVQGNLVITNPLKAEDIN